MFQTEVPRFVDQVLKCCDCGQDFTFTAGECSFYWRKGLIFPPRRCPECRAIRKLSIAPPGGRNG